jgi:hypothetical protein
MILPSLTRKMTPQLLTQTGLGSVFEDAITPSSMYLPSLTPLPESLKIVEAAWDASLALHDSLFPAVSTDTPKPTNASLIQQTTNTKRPEDSKPTPEQQRIKFLLKHLREEWFQAWSYTYPSHPPLLTLLLQILTRLIPLLGIHTIVHLKDIIPILSTLLLDPFILSTVDGRDMYKEAIILLREMLLAAWMRIASDEGRRMEVLSLVVGAWTALKERQEESEDVGELIDQICRVGRVFVKAVEVGDKDVVERFRDDVARLEEVDERMGELFGLTDG